MEATPKGKNAKKKKFKQTRQLVNLALNDGWSQTEIGNACRTHQSVVSKWKNGAAEATEGQLMPLLEIYGYKLRRNSFRVYWSLEHGSSEPTFHKVEGRIILSQTFFEKQRSHASSHSQQAKNLALQKIVVHDQGRGRFRLIQQDRVLLNEHGTLLECSHEDAIWLSSISEQLTTEQLLTSIETYCIERLKGFPSDSNTLPFLIRKALLNHGHHVDGIVEYPALW